MTLVKLKGRWDSPSWVHLHSHIRPFHCPCRHTRVSAFHPSFQPCEGYSLIIRKHLCIITIVCGDTTQEHVVEPHTNLSAENRRQNTTPKPIPPEMNASISEKQRATRSARNETQLNGPGDSPMICIQDLTISSHCQKQSGAEVPSRIE